MAATHPRRGGHTSVDRSCRLRGAEGGTAARRYGGTAVRAASVEPAGEAHFLSSVDPVPATLEIRRTQVADELRPAADPDAAPPSTWRSSSQREAEGGIRFAVAVADPSQLRYALGTRAVIEQAKGALMHAYGLSADAALRRYSQDHNVKTSRRRRVGINRNRDHSGEEGRAACLKQLTSETG